MCIPDNQLEGVPKGAKVLWHVLDHNSKPHSQQDILRGLKWSLLVSDIAFRHCGLYPLSPMNDATNSAPGNVLFSSASVATALAIDRAEKPRKSESWRKIGPNIGKLQNRGKIISSSFLPILSGFSILCRWPRLVQSQWHDMASRLQRIQRAHRMAKVRSQALQDLLCPASSNNS